MSYKTGYKLMIFYLVDRKCIISQFTVDDLLGDGVEWRRFLFHGTKEQQEKLEAALSKDGVSRKTIYMILKYLTINPDCQDILQKQFPDVQQVLLQNECPEWIL